MSLRTDQARLAPARTIRPRFPPPLPKGTALTSAALSSAWIGGPWQKQPPRCGTMPLQVAVITGGTSSTCRIFTACSARSTHRGLHSTHGRFRRHTGNVRDSYDVLLFYIMLQRTRRKPTARAQRTRRGRCSNVRRDRAGHRPHASRVTGLCPIAPVVGSGRHCRAQFTFDHDQKLQVQVADANHPITRGLQSWR